MCFDTDSHPPIAPMAGAAVAHEHLALTASDGTVVPAFAAQAGAGPSPAAMLILPDVRGLHTYYEELALRFAEAGIDALALDYFGRTAPNAQRGEGFDHAPYIAQVRWDELQADIAAGAAQLRAGGERALFTVGFCFGGRLSLLTPTLPGLRVSGAVGFYGWPVGASRGGVPAPADVAADNRAPVLAIFGGADQGITSDLVAAYEAALQAAGAAREVVTEPGAPHSFFDRKQAEFADASADAWRRVLAFVARNTPGAAAAL
ncbi:MAG: dienelactone hydrolase family protein [Candidatus Limnocylindrales bacterium]